MSARAQLAFMVLVAEAGLARHEQLPEPPLRAPRARHSRWSADRAAYRARYDALLDAYAVVALAEGHNLIAAGRHATLSDARAVAEEALHGRAPMPVPELAVLADLLPELELTP